MSVNVKEIVERLMGKLVVVTKVLHRNEHEHNGAARRLWEPVKLDPFRTGWVVGVRWVQNGTYVPASGGGGGFGIGYEDTYEPASLAVESVVPVLLVAFWPTETAEKVPFNGYCPVHMMTPAPKPRPRAGCTWTDRDREIQRQITKEMKRDERGRFVKEG